MRNISFRAKDAQEAGKRLEEALNADVDQSQRLDQDKMQRFGDAIASLLELMPEGRSVAVSISMHNGSEPDADGKERVKVSVASVTDRQGQREGASSDELAATLSSGDDAHAREVAAAEQAERDRQARAAQSQADALRNRPAEPGVRAGDVVNP